MLEKGDIELRVRLDPREDNETREEMCNIYKQMIEGEADVNLQCRGQTNPMIILMNKTKLYD